MDMYSIHCCAYIDEIQYGRLPPKVIGAVMILSY
jgi:hypothetical protein